MKITKGGLMCTSCKPATATLECDFCGIKGCRQCLELWTGPTEPGTGYQDEHWVCYRCGEANTVLSTGQIPPSPPGG